MPALPPDRTPVIVGIGEITDRPVDEPTPIGHPGIVSTGDDGLLTWKAA